MKAGIIFILVLLVSTIAAQFLVADPGYIVVDFQGYIIETTVPGLLFFVLLLAAIVWAIRKVFLTLNFYGEAAGQRRAKRSGIKMTRGMIEMAEGNLSKGERILARSASTSGVPLLNYLQAARAAHLQGQNERRDEWLKLAYQKVPEASSAVLLTQAEFQLDQGQLEMALATLKQLDEKSEGHGHALDLMARLYFWLEDWTALREVLPRVRKYAEVKPETLADWTVRAYRDYLDQAADNETITAAWKDVPKPHKSNLTLLEAYYNALMRTAQHERAEKELTAAIKSEWRGPLVRLFGLVDGPDPSKQLKKAENWLSTHSDDPDLLLTAARLCLRNELWGKARSYLETVVTIRPTPEAYRVYGALLNQLGESDAAAEAYRDGLSMMAENDLPALPHIKG